MNPVCAFTDFMQLFPCQMYKLPVTAPDTQRPSGKYWTDVISVIFSFPKIPLLKVILAGLVKSQNFIPRFPAVANYLLLLTEKSMSIIGSSPLFCVPRHFPASQSKMKTELSLSAEVVARYFPHFEKATVLTALVLTPCVNLASVFIVFESHTQIIGFFPTYPVAMVVLFGCTAMASISSLWHSLHAYLLPHPKNYYEFFFLSNTTPIEAVMYTILSGFFK